MYVTHTYVLYVQFYSVFRIPAVMVVFFCYSYFSRAAYNHRLWCITAINQNLTICTTAKSKHSIASKAGALVCTCSMQKYIN